MYLRCSLSLVILVLLINFDSSVNAIRCTNDSECPAKDSPICTLPLCINNKCGILQPCHPPFTGENCTTDSDCPANDLCEKCSKYQVPECATGKCINKQCAVIGPCTVTLDH